MAQIFVSAWLTFSLALVAQIFASAWLKYSLTFTLKSITRRKSNAKNNIWRKCIRIFRLSRWRFGSWGFCRITYKAPAGSVLSVPFGVGVNSCYCVGCEIIKGAAALDKLLYGAAGGLDLRHYCSQTYSLIVYAQARVVYFHSIVHFLSKKR